MPGVRSRADPSNTELEFRKVQLKRARAPAEKDAEIAHSERALQSRFDHERGRVMAHTQSGGASSTTRARRRSQAGFSLVEIVIAGLVLAIAVCGMSGSMVSAVAVNRVNRETALAQEAVQRQMELLQGTEFTEVFRRFNTTAADDAGLLGGAAGPNFAVFGLDVQDGDADGRVGRVEFPVIDVAGVPQLREDVVDAALGMPRDLNGSGGAPDALNHANDYRVLPVRVRVQWRGVAGPRTLTAEGMLSAR